MKAVSADIPRRLLLSEIGPRTFAVVEPGICYRLSVPGVNVTFEVDRCVWHRQELAGELMVQCHFLGTDAIDDVLSVATFNVSGARSRTDRAKQLARQSRAHDIPWEPLLEELCQRVLTAERTGEPAIALCDVERLDDDERTVHLAGFALPWKHPSILFGDGGTCKSYLALYLAGLLAEEGHRVALFDWELDAADHRERFGRLFDTMPATVFYTRCSRPLIYEADRLKRIVRQQQIDFAIFDSVGFACHEAPETADAALSYFRATRQIGIGGLHVAHINKADGGDQKPFGSTFWFNSARAIWNLKASEDGAGGLTLGVFDRKPSLRARQQPFALDVAFGERTTFTRSEIADVEAFASKLSMPYRLRNLLKAGAKTRDDIADALGSKPDTLRRTINREIERGRLVRFPGPGGVEQIGLPARSA